MCAELRVHVQHIAELQGLLVAAGAEDISTTEARLSDHVSTSSEWWCAVCTRCARPADFAHMSV